ncbi:hypothetical protein [Brevibacillus parabrevis]|uniref:hypothetical protein n=1 Tax=Brevibacillus parabrevis TaxID=54914 RepID=UPI002E2226BB|nr:hypothetical protein [Brevibacillus parabrevis]
MKCSRRDEKAKSEYAEDARSSILARHARTGLFFWSWNEVAGIVERAGTIFERLFPKGRANYWLTRLTRLTRADTP